MSEQRSTKVRVGEVVLVRFGSRHFEARVVEDRGQIGAHGRQLVRVRDLKNDGDDGSDEYEVPAEELERQTEQPRRSSRVTTEVVGADPYSSSARAIDLAIVSKRAMAKNGKVGEGHRQGAVRERSQMLNAKTGQLVKRDAGSGRFMDVTQSGRPFKGVRKEK